MPHIKPEYRNQYRDVLMQLPTINTKGDLEYCHAVLQTIYMSTREFRYSDLHSCKSATEHAAYEFGRTFLDVREDQAVRENGSAYELAERKEIS